jgi:hypothetical protein
MKYDRPDQRLQPHLNLAMHKSHVHKLLPEYILSELGIIIIIIIIRHWVIDVGVSFSKMMALAILLNNSHVSVQHQLY